MTLDTTGIGEEILRQLPYDPNPQQMELVAAFCKFVADSEPRPAFVLNGYAGTGKTSLTSALVRALSAAGIRTILLAPTGRAAKVFASYSGHGASTIHHHIYQSRKFDPQAMTFSLKRNNYKNTYFIVPSRRIRRVRHRTAARRPHHIRVRGRGVPPDTTRRRGAATAGGLYRQPGIVARSAARLRTDSLQLYADRGGTPAARLRHTAKRNYDTRDNHVRQPYAAGNTRQTVRRHRSNHR